MRLDHFGNPVFNETDLFEALYQGQKLSHEMFVEISDNIRSLEEVSNLKFWLPLDDYDLSIEEYDSAMQADWSMPD